SLQHEKSFNERRPLDGSELDEEAGVPKEWNDEWNNWKIGLEDDYKNFIISLQKGKESWMQHKSNEWNEWIKMVQNKWKDICENINKIYKSPIYKKSLTWNENFWNKWIHTEWKQDMGKDWQIWINDVEINMRELIDDRWNHWQKYQKFLWLMRNWTDEECECVNNMENKKTSDSEKTEEFIYKGNNKFYWKNKKWENWVQSKENFITKIKYHNWLQWKQEKYSIFNKYRDNLIEKLANEKQLSVFVTDG
ncbi:tryptophan-rich antigen, partial [Plasmodium malariae]